MATETLDPRRILVIDDNDAIHNDFKKTLATTPMPAASKLSGAKAALFGDIKAATAELTMPKFDVDTALQGQEGLTKLEESLRSGHPFQVAFVDMRMPPGWDGVQTIQRLWQADPNVQVVICTAYSDYSWEEISKKLGLTDRLLILKKPFDPLEIIQIATSLSEKWSLRKKAQLKMDELETMVQARTQELVHAALHDKLTGLPNRTLLKDRIVHAIERGKRNPEYHFALFFLDFDRFKLINDSLGHDVGDELLVEISKRLGRAVRPTDSVCKPQEMSTAARLGGDEFVILADDLKSDADAGRIGDRLLECLGQTYELKGHKVSSTASIGITTSTVAYQTADEMIRDADTAMYHAKAAGKARYVMFDRQMHERVTARLQMENDLRHAIERNQLFLQYQPVFSMIDGAIVGFEALVRWNHPTRGVITPNDFVPCAEETGLIIPIGYWIISEACRQLKVLRQASPNGAELFMGVNISARQLCFPELVSRVREILNQAGVEPQSLIFEITETVMIRNADATIPVLEELRTMGIRLHMDDFGTGYSSLSCLHHFPLSGLKIDKSFVQSATNARHKAIVRAIVSLATGLGISLVAEGIETSEQLAVLKQLECSQGQGFYFSPPLDSAAALDFLRIGKSIGEPPAIRAAG
jgi:diguanylate cyclase (GGDEF)-like protein